MSILFGRNRNAGTLLGILYGVIHNIDQNLHNQPGIHPGHKQLISEFCLNYMLLTVAVHVKESFGYNLLH
ncbi:hypothetical protein D3C75_983100 [compost metagenome]